MHEDGKIQQNPGLLDVKGHFRHGSNEIKHSYWSRALNWSQGF
jgi:hypothetical protein